MKKVYVNAQWQGGADRSTYDGAEELRKYLPGQDYVILPVSTEEAEMAVMRNGIRDLMFYTGRCSPLLRFFMECLYVLSWMSNASGFSETGAL